MINSFCVNLKRTLFFFFLKEKCFEREFSQTSALFSCFVLFLSFFFGHATWHVGS